MVVHARTLELYRQLGLADSVVARGRKASGNFWVAGKMVGHVVFGDMGEGISPFPYALIFPQDEHERLLIDRLAGTEVIDSGTELLSFEDANGHVIARLKRPDGSAVACEAAYIAGCDGAHSVVREAMGIGFPGGMHEHLFYVADVDASGPTLNGELHVAMDTTDFLVVSSVEGGGRARLIGIREDADPQHENPSWNDVSKRIIGWLGIDVNRVHWFSTYRVHHRVADRFQKGRAFVLGDAAHIHSPVGGQGMNTGSDSTSCDRTSRSSIPKAPPRGLRLIWARAISRRHRRSHVAGPHGRRRLSGCGQTAVWRRTTFSSLGQRQGPGVGGMPATRFFRKSIRWRAALLTTCARCARPDGVHV